MTRALIKASALSVALATGLTAAGQTASAHHKVPDFSERLAFISGKIERGRQSGRITFLEGRKLARMIRATLALRSDLASDGHLSRHDRRVLNRELTRVNAAVNSERSDRRRRLRVLPRVGR
ncbi:MAG: hypothetical protein AAFQ45_05485 [Pseudomonadota bacterium]